MISETEHVSADGKWRATNPHPKVRESNWKLEQLVLGRWVFVDYFRDLARVRSHIAGKANRTAKAQARKWFGPLATR